MNIFDAWGFFFDGAFDEKVPSVHSSWKPILTAPELKDAWQHIRRALKQAHSQKHIIYPARENILLALRLCSFQDTKVVIIGQDPYHAPNQAHGLAFSVENTQPPPPSLRNIIQELTKDLSLATTHSHCLIPWAKQGVLLLNRSLTVEKAKPLSHQEIGWYKITESIVEALAQKLTHRVFILWGKHAQKLESTITCNKQHLVIKSSHPSPFSANTAYGENPSFFGSKPFSKANEYLKANGQIPINWQL